MKNTTETKRYSGKEERVRSDTGTRKYSVVVEQGDSSVEEWRTHSEERTHSDMDDQKYSDIEERIRSYKKKTYLFGYRRIVLWKNCGRIQKNGYIRVWMIRGIRT